MAEFAEKELAYNGFTKNDLDWIIAHQANLRILEGVASRLDVPMSKWIVNLDRYGNTSAATVPTALDEAVRSGKIREGQLVLLDVFGAGVTQGACLLRW
jgi:3-oxoacyl-[acyl-carrier-protein] synthase-3